MPLSSSGPRSYTEWRACAGDHDHEPDRSYWSPDRDEALAVEAEFRKADPPWDDIWLERRQVTMPERHDEQMSPSALPNSPFGI